MRVKIKEIEKRDLKEVFQILHENYVRLVGKSDEFIRRYDLKLYGSTYKYLTLSNLRNWFERRNEEKERILVARIGEGKTEKVVGFIDFTKGKQICYIEELHVKIGFRRRGIGSTLLKRGEDLVSKYSRLVILESNLYALPFFLKHDYVCGCKAYDYISLPFYFLFKKLHSKKSQKNF